MATPNKAKKHIVTSFHNLSAELQEAVKQQYPLGFTEAMMRVDKPNGGFFYAVPFDTEEVAYLVKIDVKIDEHRPTTRRRTTTTTKSKVPTRFRTTAIPRCPSGRTTTWTSDRPDLPDTERSNCVPVRLPHALPGAPGKAFPCGARPEDGFSLPG